jgi:hypothetical protein
MKTLQILYLLVKFWSNLYISYFPTALMGTLCLSLEFSGLNQEKVLDSNINFPFLILKTFYTCFCFAHWSYARRDQYCICSEGRRMFSFLLLVTNLWDLIMNLDDIKTTCLISLKLLEPSHYRLHLWAAYNRTSKTEIYFKVRGHEVPQGCFMYH